jgi:hypothetical protein
MIITLEPLILRSDGTGIVGGPAMSDDPETISLRVTLIGGERFADDYEVIWRGLVIGRILKQPGAPLGKSQWWYGCNLASRRRQPIVATESISRIAKGGSRCSGLGYASA